MLLYVFQWHCMEYNLVTSLYIYKPSSTSVMIHYSSVVLLLHNYSEGVHNTISLSSTNINDSVIKFINIIIFVILQHLLYTLGVFIVILVLFFCPAYSMIVWGIFLITCFQPLLTMKDVGQYKYMSLLLTDDAKWPYFIPHFQCYFLLCFEYFA